MSQPTLESLYIDELKDLYSVEKQLAAALPKLAREASDDALRRLLLEHLEETRGHQERLEQLFQSFSQSPGRMKCKGIEAIIEEGGEAIDELEDGPLKDAAIIAGGQKAEHYEMCGYGTAAAFADQLGRGEDAKVLRQTLEEEKAADQKLSGLAVSVINQEAQSTPAQGEESSARRGNGRPRGSARRAGDQRSARGSGARSAGRAGARE